MWTARSWTSTALRPCQPDRAEGALDAADAGGGVINGDATFDPRAFNGLSKRLTPGGPQTVDNISGTVKLTRLEALVDSVNALRRREGAAHQQGGPAPDQPRLP